MLSVRYDRKRTKIALIYEVDQILKWLAKMIDKLIHLADAVKNIDTASAAIIVVGLGFLVVIMALAK